MSVVFELVIDGRIVDLDHPEHGRFNAAGDFDRLLPLSTQLPVQHGAMLELLGRIDAFGSTEFDVDDMNVMRSEIEALRLIAREGPERRGVDRLAWLVAHGSRVPGATLRATGD